MARVGMRTRSCIWIERAGRGRSAEPIATADVRRHRASPAPVDIETDPVSCDLFDVDIDAGTIHRITYSAG